MRDCAGRARQPVKRLVFALAIVLTGCTGGDDGPAPERADYMLHWYARKGTDYGDIVPGFKTLAMCRRAGASKTIASFGEQPIWTATGPAMPEGATPWFECLSECRPHIEGGYLLVCKHIASFERAEALSPH